MVWKHRLSDLGMQEMTANCAECGPVSVSMKDGRAKCSVARRMARGIRKARPNKRMKGHGLTVAEAGKMKDGAICAICGSAEKLRIDHDHKSMKVRGVLCNSCNLGLGFFRDSQTLLLKAVEYLKE